MLCHQFMCLKRRYGWTHCIWKIVIEKQQTREKNGNRHFTEHKSPSKRLKSNGIHSLLNNTDVRYRLLYVTHIPALCQAQWRRLNGAREARAPTFINGRARGGHRELKNNKQETDQTVLTVTKALTKTTNCVFRAKKERARPKKFPHVQIRSRATGQA